MNSEDNMDSYQAETNTILDNYNEIMKQVNIECERCQYFDKEYNITTSL